jgi:hypothetical protein
MTNKSQLKPWALQMMLHWDNADPVSAKETDRNNAVYGIQHNRNPFIDHPEFVYQIWGNPVSAEDIIETQYQMVLYPNPAGDYASFDLPARFSNHFLKIMILSATGEMFSTAYNQHGNTIVLELRSLPRGLYVVLLIHESAVYHTKLVKS